MGSRLPGIPYELSPWVSGVCSVTCGINGVQVSVRSCIPGDCGPSCVNASMYATVQCGTDGLGQWSAWSNCSTTCGLGQQLRTRTAMCPAISNDTVDTQNCYEGPPSLWTAWAPVGNCSTQCGVGVQQTIRNCSGCYGTCDGSNASTVSCSQGSLH